MTALLALELRRQRPMFVRMALVTVVIGLVFFVAGKRTPADLLATLVGSGLGVALIVPMGIARDKMEGTLEFICTTSRLHDSSPLRSSRCRGLSGSVRSHSLCRQSEY